MDIQIIKAELEKLSHLLSQWESADEVSAIERDLALDKLKKIYDMVRFPAQMQTATDAPIVPAAPPKEQPSEENIEDTEESAEPDVEVELIFAEDDDTEEEIANDDSSKETSEEVLEEILEDVSEEDATPFVSEILSSALGIAAAEKVEENAEEKIENEEEAVAEVEIEVETEPTPEPIAEPEPTPVPKAEAPRTINSLFGMEEVQRRPRSKHQRMMSIYNDSDSRHEKVVDISKIFDMDIDSPKPMTSKISESAPTQKPTPQSAPKSEPKAVEREPMAIVEAEADEPATTLAEVIATPSQTIADTISTPTPLAEEMNHARISSLRDGIGLNDKFLMIRDLFDGDGEAYDEAISSLDELETLDDCMIHIIENYAWNPDTEGSKFIMQLLERKLS